MEICLVVGLLLYGVLRVGEWMVTDLMRRGKKRILWVDDDARQASVSWVRTGTKVAGVQLAENEFVLGKGDAGKVYRLEGKASYGGRWPTWIMNPRTGLNLTGPTDAETMHKDTFHAVLSIFDPSSYYKAISRNEASDTLSANEDADKNSWVLPVVVIGGVVLLGCFGMLAFIVTKMQHAGGAAGA